MLEKALLKWEGYALNSLLVVGGGSHLIIWFKSLLTHRCFIWDMIRIKIKDKEALFNVAYYFFNRQH